MDGTLRLFYAAHEIGDPINYKDILMATNEYHMCPHLEVVEVRSNNVHIKFLRGA